MEKNLFNIDLVGAKSGKKLSKFENALQYIVNLVLTRLFQIFVIGVIILLVFIVLNIVLKLMYIILMK